MPILGEAGIVWTGIWVGILSAMAGAIIAFVARVTLG